MKKIALALVVLIALLAAATSGCTLPYKAPVGSVPTPTPFTSVINTPGDGLPTPIPQAGGEKATATQIGQATAAATSTPAPATATLAPATATQIGPTTAPTQIPAASNTPQPVASPVPANAVRVQFQAGATSASVDGELGSGETKSYLLKASAGQTLKVEVWSPNGDVYLTVSGVTDGKVLVDFQAKTARWEGSLPADQDYLIGVTAGDGTTSYSIDFDIPAQNGTPQPSSTPSANTLDPDKAFGKAKFTDPMNGGNKAAWVNAKGEYPNTDSIKLSVENSKFYVTGKQPGFSTWWFSWPNLKDFYLQMSVDSGACSGKDAYGLIVRGPAHQAGKSYGYVVSFSCDGAYKVFRLDSADPFTAVTLVDWTQSDAINEGSNQTNLLGIKAVGSVLAVYANGQKVTELTDSTYTEGRYGLFVSPTDTRNYVFRVIQMAYWVFGK